ncbi:DUF6214 family protein [Streptomyces sp. NPDC020681]|uniref:DUF6214 family protein n=1 Tax=Streptomyces sp. NPDC020681 TaxID=3365083 RepID=UPI00379D3E7A
MWEVQSRGTVTVEPSPAYEISSSWFDVRLTFADGARVDVLAVVEGGRIAIEDLRADPPLPLEGFTVLADRIEDPLEDACLKEGQAEPVVAAQAEAEAEDEAPRPGHRRARAVVPRGRAGRRIAADAYRAAQQSGLDPVLAVMNATGRSRRKSLRLIAGARDDGYLAPRHNRRRSWSARVPVTWSASG